jgi:hypothetical protein
MNFTHKDYDTSLKIWKQYAEEIKADFITFECWLSLKTGEENLKKRNQMERNLSTHCGRQTENYTN